MRSSTLFVIVLFTSILVGTAVAADRGIPLLVTVDDLPLTQGSLYPGEEERDTITNGLLAALDAHGIEAIGFVTWRNVTSEADRGLLERWLEAGHELGNHSFHHLSLTSTEVSAYIEDLEACRVELAALLEPHDRRIRFFRFPFLREGDSESKFDAVRSYLADSGQRSVPVTFDNSDYAFNRAWFEAKKAGDQEAAARQAQAYHEDLHLAVRSQRKLSERLYDRTVPQVLLLHANAIGGGEWDELFTWLEGQGFRFASADEVLADPAFEDEPRWIGLRGPGLWQRIKAVTADDEARAAIHELFAEQTRAWNRGDLEAFTSIYSEQALFVSPSGTTRGRSEVLARYRKRYPDHEAMGSLSLEPVELRLNRGLEITLLGSAVPSRIHGATLVARWRLSYPDQDPSSGLTMLALEPTPDGWIITQDASF